MKEQEWTCPVKPEDIPKEYTYVAQDKCGEWYAFRYKPRQLDLYFWCISSVPKFLATCDENLNWRETVQKIPR
jgi:hypothetical protein